MTVANLATNGIEAPAPCDHAASMVPVVRTHANGSRHYGWQCLTCGQWQPARREQRRQWATPPARTFDESIRERYQQEQARRWEQYRFRRHEVYELERVAENREWWARYRSRLTRPDWEQKRLAVLKRDGGLCQARLVRCRTVASEVHHLSYRHFGNEPLFELVAVCRPCHEQITGMDRDE